MNVRPEDPSRVAPDDSRAHPDSEHDARGASRRARSRKSQTSRTWRDIGSDVDWQQHGGKWARKVGNGRYHVVQFENCEDWGDGAEGYCASLDEVNLFNADAAQIESARQFIGADDYEAQTGEKLPELGLVEAFHSYGLKAPLWSEQGANSHQLMRAAKHESRVLCENDDEYEARMSRPVNKIGSTAREFQRGDIDSALDRALHQPTPSPEAEIMRRIMRGGHAPKDSHR